MELIRHYRTDLSNGRVRLCAEARYDSPKFNGLIDTFYFEYPSEVANDLVDNGNPWLVLFLPVSVVLHESLRITRPVDPLLLENCLEMLEVWNCWMPHLPVIEIEAAVEQEHCESHGMTAAYFSAGVDSMYTLCHHIDAPEASRAEKIDELITIFGIFGREKQLVDEQRGLPMLDRIQRIAKRSRVDVVDVHTNVWQTRFGFTNSLSHSHTCLLAASTLALGKRYSRVLIPASASYLNMLPDACHPLTDKMFTASSTRFISDGCNLNRFQKMVYLKDYQHSFASLQICSRDPDLKNCSDCFKCIRSMLFLEVLNKLDECELFREAELNLDKVSRMYCSSGFVLTDLETIYVMAQKQEKTDLVQAIETLLSRSTWIDAGRRAIRKMRRYQPLTQRDQSIVAEILGRQENRHCGPETSLDLRNALQSNPQLQQHLQGLLTDPNNPRLPENGIQENDFIQLEKALLWSSYCLSGLDMQIRNPEAALSDPELIFLDGKPLLAGGQKNIDRLFFSD